MKIKIYSFFPKYLLNVCVQMKRVFQMIDHSTTFVTFFGYICCMEAHVFRFVFRPKLLKFLFSLHGQYL